MVGRKKKLGGRNTRWDGGTSTNKNSGAHCNTTVGEKKGKMVEKKKRGKNTANEKVKKRTAQGRKRYLVKGKEKKTQARGKVRQRRLLPRKGGSS